MERPDEQTQRAIQGDPNPGEEAARPAAGVPHDRPKTERTPRDKDPLEDPRLGDPDVTGQYDRPNRPRRPDGERRDSAGNPRGGMPDERIQPQR
jgi:hypothetical protein